MRLSATGVSSAGPFGGTLDILSPCSTLLAATAMEHDLYLATRNIRDVRHSGAAIFNPWDDVASSFPILPRPKRSRAPTS
jgi:hypothetical protein